MGVEAHVGAIFAAAGFGTHLQVDERENRRVDADVEPQSEDRQSAEARILPEDASGETEIAAEMIPGHPAAGLVESLFGRAPRCRSCGARREERRRAHPLVLETIGLQLEVRLNFAVEIAVLTFMAEHLVHPLGSTISLSIGPFG